MNVVVGEEREGAEEYGGKLILIFAEVAIG
jgi:hypothetical protein